MDTRNRREDAAEQSKRKWGRPKGPVVVGALFTLLAIALTLLGLWRANNLSLQNVLLAVALCGGTWGLVSWAIATAVAQVEDDVTSQSDKDG